MPNVPVVPFSMSCFKPWSQSHLAPKNCGQLSVYVSRQALGGFEPLQRKQERIRAHRVCIFKAHFLRVQVIEHPDFFLPVSRILLTVDQNVWFRCCWKSLSQVSPCISEAEPLAIFSLWTFNFDIAHKLQSLFFAVFQLKIQHRFCVVYEKWFSTTACVWRKGRSVDWCCIKP